MIAHPCCGPKGVGTFLPPCGCCLSTQTWDTRVARSGECGADRLRLEAARAAGEFRVVNSRFQKLNSRIQENLAAGSG